MLATAFTIGFFIVRRAYRRSQEKHRVLVTTREMELDFDTNDIETGTQNPSKGHSRSWSDDSDVPLIRVGSKQRPLSSSKASFDSDVQSVSTYASSATDSFGGADTRSIQRTLDSMPYTPTKAPPHSSIPVIKLPSPPPKSTMPMPEDSSADHQFGKLVARPSFLTRPRSAPRPGVSRSRSRSAANMRSTLLNRLASTRLPRRERSDEGEDAEEDSPSSVYSQASAMPSTLEDQGNPSDDVPPVPPIPLRFQLSLKDIFIDSAASRDHSVGEHQILRDARHLEESLAFPLPTTPDEKGFAMQAKGPVTKLLPGLWANSPSSTSPSPSHSPSDRLPATPTDGAVISVRSTEVHSNVPQYILAHTENVEERGMVGYHLPFNWRNSQSSVPISVVPSPFPAPREPMPTTPTPFGLAC